MTSDQKNMSPPARMSSLPRYLLMAVSAVALGYQAAYQLGWISRDQEFSDSTLSIIGSIFLLTGLVLLLDDFKNRRGPDTHAAALSESLLHFSDVTLPSWASFFAGLAFLAMGWSNEALSVHAATSCIVTIAGLYLILFKQDFDYSTSPPPAKHRDREFHMQNQFLIKLVGTLMALGGLSVLVLTLVRTYNN